MDDYKKGKQLLDAEDFSSAQIHFQAGLSAGDARCAYGLLALAAMTGAETQSAEQELSNVWAELLQKADSGDGDCCFIVARCLETGKAVPQDMALAMKYYTRSANFGNADAMFNLGCLYISMGSGGRKIAREYFTDAAAAGCAQAQAALLYMQEEDSGTAI